jgi:hypothetical protein
VTQDSLRPLVWTGAPILDACAVQADYGHLLMLTADGLLHGVNLDARTIAQLCKVELPVFEYDGSNDHSFGAPKYKLHASSGGRYAAIVVDRGQQGLVVNVISGAVTMRLNGGDYCEDTVPFSACFLRFEERDVFVHRTAWNRLDASDPATGNLLTDRYIAPYEQADERPSHYLDYFHGRLQPSPDGSRLFDDGWVWHPISIPRTWSVTDWLGSYPWEAEDGPSIVYLTQRDDWNTPACWISNRHIAVWELAAWAEDEFEERGLGLGVQILDANESKQSSDGRWPMEIDAKKIFDLFSDGERLYVAADTGTTVWDIASRAQIAALPDFTARVHDRVRNTLVAIRTDAIVEVSVLALAENKQHKEFS